MTCVELMVDCIHMLKLTQFNVSTRNAIVKPVSQCILRVMNTIVHNFRMPLKEGELKTVTVGMLYLRRKGVVFEDITVLPVMSELRVYLPSENMLAAFFERECVLFIGTQFSNLYTTVDMSAKGIVGTSRAVQSQKVRTG